MIAILDTIRAVMRSDGMPRGRCPACASRELQTLGEVSLTFDAKFSRNSFDLVRCRTCETIFQTPLPTSNDFKTMYETHRQFDSGAYRDPEKVRTAMEYYGNCFRSMADILGRRQNIRVLEIGSGLAWMCRAAKQQGFPDTITVAQDVTAECESECGGWVDEYLVGSIEDRRIDIRAPYDIVSLTHVIEHLPDPKKSLRHLRPLLGPAGCVFITAPHRPEAWAGSMVTWSSWSYNHVPGHLQYFSKAGIEAVGKASGLSVVSWSLHENGQAFEAILRPRLEDRSL